MELLDDEGTELGFADTELDEEDGKKSEATVCCTADLRDIVAAVIVKEMFA